MNPRLTPLLLLFFVLPVCFAVAEPTLKDAFKDEFMIGVALKLEYFGGQGDPGRVETIKREFNSVTAENVMKWEHLQPRRGAYKFEAADKFVAFGESNGMFVVGHTLVWHSQTPSWVFQNEAGGAADRETLLARMRDHIHTVVGRYKGRVKGWDVVNEALAEDGTLRDSPWKRIIGEDYIAKAFQFAHEADPKTELYYNDYGIEHDSKRAGAVKLLRGLRDAGVPVHGVGIQEHVTLTWPSPETLDQTISDFAALGLKVMITELDVEVLPRAGPSDADVSRSEKGSAGMDPYTGGLPPDVQQALANRYAELFKVYSKHHDVVTRVTLWGFADDDSWLNNWPIRGRTNHALLFDRAGRPKPSHRAVLGVGNP